MTDRSDSRVPLAAPFPGAATLFSPTILAFVRIGGMAVLIAGTAFSSHAQRTDQRVALGVLLGIVLAAYAGWVASRRTGRDGLALASLAALAACGGAAGALSGFGVGFVAIIGIFAGDVMPDALAVGYTLFSVAALAVALSVLGGDFTLVGWASLAGAGGLMAGLNRRQYRLRAEQSEQLLDERERTAAEAAHAAALEERNRIAREVHDVLAHSLSALAVQLDTLDALLDDGEVERAREMAATSRRLAVEGLDETRRAVGALRGVPVDLVAQLKSLAAAGNASFRADGTERPLPPESALAVYRAAQEALTNVRKHAPGARVAVSLRFGMDEVALDVVDAYEDGASPPKRPIAGSASGFGLQGMRERVELLGGSVDAGPLVAAVNGRAAEGCSGTGWKVAVRLPLEPAAAGT